MPALGLKEWRRRCDTDLRRMNFAAHPPRKREPIKAGMAVIGKFFGWSIRRLSFPP